MAGDRPQSALRRPFRQLVSRLGPYKTVMMKAAGAPSGVRKCKEKAGIKNQALFDSMLGALSFRRVMHRAKRRATLPNPGAGRRFADLIEGCLIKRRPDQGRNIQLQPTSFREIAHVAPC